MPAEPQKPLRPRRLAALQRRGPLLLACALLAALARLAQPGPPERSVEGVAAMLSERGGAEVAPTEFVWERSRGPLLDPLLGRDVLFLGRSAPSAPRDLYRARVRVTHEGRPIAVRWVRNLTRTPLADEDSLIAQDRHAAYVTRAFDAVPAVTVLDLDDGTRSDVLFGLPPTEAQIELRGDALIMALHAQSGKTPTAAALDLAGDRLSAGAADSYRARSWHTPRRVERPLDELRHWLRQLRARTPQREALSPVDAPPATASGASSWPPAALGGAHWKPADGSAAASGEAALLQSDAGGLSLIAIDARQLELRVAAGFAHPHPQTGPHEDGRIASDDRERAVAAFNGAAPDATAGMVAHGRLLTPLVDGLPTALTDRRGHISVGPWPAGAEVPDHAVWLRQSPDPSDDAVRTRSALCRTRDGYLMYGWAVAHADSFSAAMQRVGCEQLMHLASGAQTGFALLGKANTTALGAIDAQRFVDASADDFFYLVRRTTAPQIPLQDQASWKPDGGAQPPPSWLPAAHRASVELLGTEVTLHAFSPGRFRWRIVAGRDEKNTRTAADGLTAAELARASVAISLGVGFRRRNRRGLVLEDVVKLPIRPDLGVLHSDGDVVHVSRAPENMVPFGDGSELVLLVESGELRSEARKLSALRRRSAACALADGTLLIATAKYDSAEPLATALRDIGCQRVVELNRGNQVRAFVHRAGTKDAPQARYDDTILYGMARHAGGGVTAMGGSR